MPFIILVNALSGLIVALLYYPRSPWYLFGAVRLDELWLWSKYALFSSSLLFVFAVLALDKDAKGRGLARSLSAFIATLQGLLNLLPAVLYLIFLHGAATSRIAVHGYTLTITSRQLFLHLLLVTISWATALWLVLKGRERNITEPAQVLEAQVQSSI
ncbi:MAG: hypothetical protein COW32_09710 [Candidatus Aquicultor secundus]|uniref:Uncharacterized protein n=1 Tax=Candidatus Aquicultor secundus TaxID=1973895 RepID=A0A2M7TAE9_9ACTN|nr:hypothetical protein [Candidatus Aquicultor secundus]NCO66367.1 hypothetical protein [Solirubrobacter sp.]OIO88591.1 MAG: hypothetical protein AUK32_01170 [Candidatus Aquicultor secundus]PIU26940.1 MAG: hypothetical protein COT10_06015 [Candidatus Aquicultor secundus]PIW21484.1 MAG: hypothetical protein COW32_09710 [Candidatus Aquicultor secundus]PIX51377.1 MAG: hypothetical protein COZ51_09990 [Candidatus Aquicultor secundus]